MTNAKCYFKSVVILYLVCTARKISQDPHIELNKYTFSFLLGLLRLFPLRIFKQITILLLLMSLLHVSETCRTICEIRYDLTFMGLIVYFSKLSTAHKIRRTLLISFIPPFHIDYSFL
jgi:hypothetical protein